MLIPRPKSVTKRIICGKEEKLDKPEPQKLQKTGTDDLFSSFYSTSPSRKVDLDKVDLDQPAYIRRQQD